VVVFHRHSAPKQSILQPAKQPVQLSVSCPVPDKPTIKINKEEFSVEQKEQKEKNDEKELLSLAIQFLESFPFDISHFSHFSQLKKNYPSYILTIMDSETLPPISISQYISRLFKYSGASIQSVVCALILMVKYCDCLPNMILHSFNIHRMFVSCFRVASKIQDDTNLSNKSFAKIGGIELKEMNALEIDICVGLNFEIIVSKEEYENMLNVLKTKDYLHLGINVIKHSMKRKQH